MDWLSELKEARAAGQDALTKVDQALSDLKSASSWGIFDILGGGTISSMVKRNKLKTANMAIHEMNRAVETFGKELADVKMKLPSQVRDTWSDNFWDIWLDNMFTDIRVQGEIKASIQELKDFKGDLIDLLDRLDAEIEKRESNS